MIDSAHVVDVVVVGAGPSGSSAALSLVREGMSVTMIGNGRRASWAGETLPPGAGDVMAGVFGASILNKHQRAYAVNAAWESSHLHETDAMSHPLGAGWLLDRLVFDAEVEQVACAAGVRFVHGQATLVKGHGRRWSITADSHRMEANWLVDATGRPAHMARRLGARVLRSGRMLAYVCRMDADGSRVAATSLEATSEGWWYTTPLPRGGRVAAYITDVDLGHQSGSLTGWWLDRLAETEHIRGLVDCSAEITVTISDAGTGYLNRCAGEGWVAVGDAAAHFDPLSSQGLLTGVLMGARVAQAIAHNKLEDWQVDYEMIVAEHDMLRSHYYSLVDRWADSTFWSRRSTELRKVVS
jgi:flavin-dependent dehydrogenase